MPSSPIAQPHVPPETVLAGGPTHDLPRQRGMVALASGLLDLHCPLTQIASSLLRNPVSQWSMQTDCSRALTHSAPYLPLTGLCGAVTQFGAPQAVVSPSQKVPRQMISDFFTYGGLHWTSQLLAKGVFGAQLRACPWGTAGILGQTDTHLTLVKSHLPFKHVALAAGTAPRALHVSGHCWPCAALLQLGASCPHEMTAMGPATQLMGPQRPGVNTPLWHVALAMTLNPLSQVTGHWLPSLISKQGKYLPFAIVVGRDVQSVETFFTIHMPRSHPLTVHTLLRFLV